jgi:hypothetical protein
MRPKARREYEQTDEGTARQYHVWLYNVSTLVLNVILSGIRNQWRRTMVLFGRMMRSEPTGRVNHICRSTE